MTARAAAQGFMANTRRRQQKLNQGTIAGDAVLRWDIPKVGYLESISLTIRPTVAGTLSSPNALGAASIVKRIRLTLNNGTQVFDCGPVGLYYLGDEMIGPGGWRLNAASTARSAVTATSFNLDTLIPVMFNARDPLGLILLQSESVVAQLVVEIESDATIATGATVSGTVEPMITWFTVPQDAANRPPTNQLHTIIEESRVVAGAGEVRYEPPRGHTYLQFAQALGAGASGSDGFSAVYMVANQNDRIYDWPATTLMDTEFQRFHGRARPAGCIYYDLVGTAGQGDYGLGRDLINTRLLTSFETVITATGAATLYTWRRQIQELG